MVFSIIAVQGLGASPYYTWVKEVPSATGSSAVREVMWLKDILPSHVKNARIATFSYLSDWYTYRRGVKISLRELGEQLLNALQQSRQNVRIWIIALDMRLVNEMIMLTEDQARRRPIIFIGHSMGGLVIKQVLKPVNSSQTMC